MCENVSRVFVQCAMKTDGAKTLTKCEVNFGMCKTISSALVPRPSLVLVGNFELQLF